MTPGLLATDTSETVMKKAPSTRHRWITCTVDSEAQDLGNILVRTMPSGCVLPCRNPTEAAPPQQTMAERGGAERLAGLGPW